MRGRKGFTLIELLVVVVIVAVGVILVVSTFGGGIYKYTHKSEFSGTVVGMGELNPNGSIAFFNRGNGRQVISFACDIQTESEIISFSSEDRKFSTVSKGDSITVVVFKYPPWNFSKAGTYYDGRLLKKLKVAGQK